MEFESSNHDQKLKALRVQLIESNGGIILKRGRVEIKIGGERAAEVVHSILTAADEDGATPDEICELFATPDHPAVRYLIQQLASRRILVPMDSAGSVLSASEGSLEVFYWHFGEEPVQVSSRLRSQRIVIMGVGFISRQLATSLAESGSERVEVVNYPLLCNLQMFDDYGKIKADQWPAPLRLPIDYREWQDRLGTEPIGCLVATSDFGGLQLMRKWNEFCIEQNCHFLPVVLQDLIGYVGPLVVPGETPCIECLRARENSNMEDTTTRRVAEAVAFEGQAIAGFHPSMTSVLGDIAAIELSKFYGGWMPAMMVGRLIEVNLLALQMTTHKVLKIPRCAACSTLNTRSSVSPYKITFSLIKDVHESDEVR